MSSGVPQDHQLHTAIAAAASPARLGPKLCCLVALLCPALGSCAMTIPMSSLLPATEDVTGSNSPVPFGRLLGEEDRRREMAALATALDPLGDGATVAWDNARSSSRGSITAVGKAFNADSKVCRAFVGELKRAGVGRTLQGTACIVSAGEWKMVEANPPKP